jgi:hypothetical protein
MEVREMMFDPNEEIEIVMGGKWIIDVVCIEENVVFICDNDMDERFWLLLVDKTIYIMQESFEDMWGNSYVEGNVVLRGY